MNSRVISANGSFDIPKFEHNFPFDPAYGYTYERYLQVQPPPAPADFKKFWESLYAQTLQVSHSPKIGQKLEERAHHVIHSISFTSLHGVHIHGWIAIPKGGKPSAAFVVGHGYGGREQIVDEELFSENTVFIFPCARGLGKSPYEDIHNNSGKHVLHGIKSKETYIHGACVADYWSAASVVLELFPEAVSHLGYMGTSFGGGIGAIMLAWDKRFHGGHICVPSFGNHPLRVTMPCTGSGNFVRELWLKKPECLDVLRYFDSATAATFIQVPMLVVCALFDPSVPPPGQFCVYNAIPSPKQLFVVQGGHFRYPEETKEWTAAHDYRDGFFRELGFPS